MSRPDWSRLLGAALIIAVALAFLVPGLNLRFGTVEKIGPGFFPSTISVILLGLGGLLALSAWQPVPPDESERHVDSVSWRPLALVAAAILVFLLVVEPFGLVPAVLATVFVAALAEAGISRTVVIVAIGMAAALALIFVVGLDVPVDIIRRPF